jgi:hypothetical protein
VMGRDAKDLAKGIARADWLQFSSEEQSRSRESESERRRRPIHPIPAHAEPPPPPPTHIPARTHTFTQTQRTLIFITIIWLFYHTRKSTTLRLLFLTFLFFSTSLPCRFRKHKILSQHCGYTNLSVPVSLSESSLRVL